MSSRVPRPPLGLLFTAIAMALAGCSSNGPAPAPPGGDPPAGDDQPAGPPLFEDVTAASGVAFTYRNGEDTADHLSILESLGGGAGLIDYDGDGLLDIFLPGGGGFAGADKKDIVGFPSKLFRNLGGLKFRDETAAAGLDKLAGGKPWFYTHGVAVADYDRDGWPDLLVTGWRQIALFRNVPVDPNDPKKGRRFEDVTAAAGLDKGIEWATSAGFGDLDGDGFPDLYVCQYADWSWNKHPKCNYDGKTPDVCAPRHFDGLTHKLYRNTGKGAFVECGKEAGLVPGGPNASKGLGVVIADFDGDGKPDVYVANDTVDNFLYMNKSTPGSLKFSEHGLLSGCARDDRGTPNGSMGVGVGDPERTGKPAIWVTNYENELHSLYRNDSKPGRPLFQFRTSASGIAAIGQKYVSWGTAFVDVDLDGWEDLFISNGHAIRYPTGKESSRKQLAVLLLNKGEGRFRDASKQIGGYRSAPRLGRGVAFGDLDNDGRTDMVLSHTNEPIAILRGTGGADNHWLGVRLEGKGRACTVGAKLTWEADGQRQTRFATGGGSYTSACDHRFLFGLGAARTGRLTVTWADGTEQKFENVAADRYYRVTQGLEKLEVEPVGAK